MQVVLGAQFYTRQVGRIWSKMITAARGDETWTTAARGGDPKATAARGFDTKGVDIHCRSDWYYDWYFDWYYCVTLRLVLFLFLRVHSGTDTLL